MNCASFSCMPMRASQWNSSGACFPPLACVADDTAGEDWFVRRAAECEGREAMYGAKPMSVGDDLMHTIDNQGARAYHFPRHRDLHSRRSALMPFTYAIRGTSSPVENDTTCARKRGEL